MSLKTAMYIVDHIAGTELKNSVQQMKIAENGDFLCNPEAIDIIRYIKKVLPHVRIDMFNNFSLLNKNISHILLSEKLIDYAITNIDSVRPDYYKIMKGLDLSNTLTNFSDFLTIRNKIYPELKTEVRIISFLNYMREIKKRLGVKPNKLKDDIKLENIQDDLVETQHWLFDNLPMKVWHDVVMPSYVMLWAERKNSHKHPGVCQIFHMFKDEVFINPSGDVYLCCYDSDCSITFGNVKNKSLDDIFRSSGRLKAISLLNEGKFQEVGWPCSTSDCCTLT